ncbi:C40 family peptidase [Bacillus thermotolerans]|uniref:C40 family peptidase n=1 Tax=Bacillus thermotolerans TaxID=1221996 RepID=UPI00057E7032|nr:C40 family peptidase [Bacillus thermotolerans]KKB36559.1 NLP/P60 family protein [Bacillus thermotolerans]
MKKFKKILVSGLASILLMTAAPAVLPEEMNMKAEVQAATIGEAMVEYGKKFMGVPYVFGGTTPSGFDCSGFTQYVYKHAAGISIPRTTDQQYKVGTSVSKSDLQPGDLVFFKNTYRKGISHVGIYAGNNMVLNATSSKGIALVSLSNSYWGPKYAGAKRVAEYVDGFKDVAESAPTHEAIMTLTDKGVIQGFDDFTFRPDEPVTRGQAAAIINRVLGNEPKVMSHFTDVPKSYRFAVDIAAIREAGIINGFPDKTFRPNEYMTRTEMAVIVQNAFDLKLGNAGAASNPYAEVKKGYWAYEPIVTMSTIDKTGIFKTEKYYGDHRATREVFTTAIYNAMNAK